MSSSSILNGRQRLLRRFTKLWLRCFHALRRRHVHLLHLRMRFLCHGPARVIALDTSTSDRPTSSGIWLSHGATRIRAVPGNLRAATPLETSVIGVTPGTFAPPNLRAPELRPQRLRRHYLDLRQHPTDLEREHALHEAPPPDAPPLAKRPRPTPPIH